MFSCFLLFLRTQAQPAPARQRRNAEQTSQRQTDKVMLLRGRGYFFCPHVIISMCVYSVKL